MAKYTVLVGMNYLNIADSLERKILDFNATEKREIPLSMAYGHAICSSSQEGSIHDSERLADQEMYNCKKRMKVTREQAICN